MRRQSTTLILAAAAMTVVTVALAGCGYSSRRSSVVQPHQFVYYPDKGVYFEPFTQSYFWKVDNTWHHTDYPPPNIVWHNEPIKIVRTLSARPYEQHRAVRGEHSRFWPATTSYPATPILEWDMVDATSQAESDAEMPAMQASAEGADVEGAGVDADAEETAVADASAESDNGAAEEESQQVVGAPTNPDE